MHSSYRNRLLGQLRDQQVRFAPRNRKLEQVNRAELLLVELLPEKNYNYEYLFYRITGYRPDVTPQEVISGEDARHDVRLFIEDVSDSADVLVEEVGEPVYTVNHLGRDVQCFDEDHFSLATARSCQPSVCL